MFMLSTSILSFSIYIQLNKCLEFLCLKLLKYVKNKNCIRNMLNVIKFIIWNMNFSQKYISQFRSFLQFIENNLAGRLGGSVS